MLPFTKMWAPLMFMLVIFFCFGNVYNVKADMGILIAVTGLILAGFAVGAGRALRWFHEKIRCWYTGYKTRKVIRRITSEYGASKRWAR